MDLSSVFRGIFFRRQRTDHQEPLEELSLAKRSERLIASLESGSVDQAAQALAAATAATAERGGAENIAPAEGDEAVPTGGLKSKSGDDASTS